MNAHSPITRDELNLMLQEPFALNCRIPGIVQEEIGKRMQLAKSLPARIPAPKGSRFCPDLIAAVKRMVERGASNDDIALDCEITKKTLYRIIKDHGLQDGRDRLAASVQARNDRILELHRQGKSTRAIGAEVGLSHYSVQRAIRKAQQ